MKFELISECSVTEGRAGIFGTDHGQIETPIFMPVGTQGTVKYVQQKELIDLGAQVILGNTFHLYLRPGHDLIEEAGGLHQFINWKGPILTDSGGYQVYSLSGMRKISEEGVKFQSPVDGSYHSFSPESATDIQKSLGADIIMAFDECTPYPCTFEYAKNSMDLTHRWLDRCLTHMKNSPPKHDYGQIMVPIVQGSTFKNLRKESALYIAEKNTEINAIGGLSVGEPAEMMYEMTAHVCEYLPKTKGRYLMGVGTPSNILECIACGIDFFDCVLPTRNARHGLLYTEYGQINIKNAKWRNDFSAIDPNLEGGIGQQYSKAYLRHLFNVEEALGRSIATLHNLNFYLWLVRKARKHIIEGDFATWKRHMCNQLNNRL